MPYVRKTKPREKIDGQWLARTRAQLLRSGMTAQELDVLYWRDVLGLTLVQMGKRMGTQRSRPHQLYNRARRKLKHPSRAALLPPPPCAAA